MAISLPLTAGTEMDHTTGSWKRAPWNWGHHDGAAQDLIIDPTWLELERNDLERFQQQDFSRLPASPQEAKFDFLTKPLPLGHRFCDISPVKSLRTQINGKRKADYPQPLSPIQDAYDLLHGEDFQMMTGTFEGSDPGSDLLCNLPIDESLLASKEIQTSHRHSSLAVVMSTTNKEPLFMDHLEPSDAHSTAPSEPTLPYDQFITYETNIFNCPATYGLKRTYSEPHRSVSEGDNSNYHAIQNMDFSPLDGDRYCQPFQTFLDRGRGITSVGRDKLYGRYTHAPAERLNGMVTSNIPTFSAKKPTSRYWKPDQPAFDFQDFNYSIRESNPEADHAWRTKRRRTSRDLTMLTPDSLTGSISSKSMTHSSSNPRQRNHAHKPRRNVIPSGPQDLQPLGRPNVISDVNPHLVNSQNISTRLPTFHNSLKPPDRDLANPKTHIPYKQSTSPTTTFQTHLALSPNQILDCDSPLLYRYVNSDSDIQQESLNYVPESYWEGLVDAKLNTEKVQDQGFSKHSQENIENPDEKKARLIKEEKQRTSWKSQRRVTARKDKLNAVSAVGDLRYDTSHLDFCVTSYFPADCR